MQRRSLYFLLPLLFIPSYAYANGYLNEILNAANAGNVDAQDDLGDAYATGKITLPDGSQETSIVDYPAAVQWWLKAAQAGDAYAQDAVGTAIHNGWGIQKDDALAVQWWLKAAAQGNAYSQNSLGEAYRDGAGVEPDNVRAYRYFSLAAAQFPPAAANRDQLALSMTPEEVGAVMQPAQPEHPAILMPVQQPDYDPWPGYIPPVYPVISYPVHRRPDNHDHDHNQHHDGKPDHPPHQGQHDQHGSRGDHQGGAEHPPHRDNTAPTPAKPDVKKDDPVSGTNH